MLPSGWREQYWWSHQNIHWRTASKVFSYSQHYFQVLHCPTL